MKTFFKKVIMDVPDFELLLVVSKDIKAIENIIDKNIKNVKENKSVKKEALETIEEECEGCYIKDGLSRFLLLTSWQNDWDHWDTLNHEVNHLVEYEASERFFMEEMEFKAYMQCGLFKKLREILKEYKGK